LIKTRNIKQHYAIYVVAVTTLIAYGLRTVFAWIIYHSHN